MINVIIADDEVPAREKMQLMLQTLPDITIDAVTKNGLEALQAIVDFKPKLAFLDIQMPGLTGIEVAENIPEDIDTKVIFTTAYQEYAIRAFELNAIDYLLKPFNAERLQMAIQKSGIKEDVQNIQKVRQELVNTEITFSTKIPVTHRDKIILIDYSELMVITVEGRGSQLKTVDNEYYIGHNLDHFEQKLPMNDFLRVNRSEMINLKQIKELVIWFGNRYKIVMNNGLEVICSREKSKIIKRILNLNHKDG